MCGPAQKLQQHQHGQANRQQRPSHKLWSRNGVIQLYNVDPPCPHPSRSHIMWEQELESVLVLSTCLLARTVMLGHSWSGPVSLLGSVCRRNVSNPRLMDIISCFYVSWAMKQAIWIPWNQWKSWSPRTMGYCYSYLILMQGERVVLRLGSKYLQQIHGEIFGFEIIIRRCDCSCWNRSLSSKGS